MDFDWLFFVEISLGGLGTGGLYALTALAFVIIFKSTGVVNLAIGEMLMVGAYLVYGLATGFGLPIWLAIIVGVLGSGLAGGVIERLAIRPMVGESPISTFMITVGLASVLVGAVELVWTADQRRMPQIMPDEAIFIGEAFVSSKVFYGFFVTSAPQAHGETDPINSAAQAMAAVGLAVTIPRMAVWRVLVQAEQPVSARYVIRHIVQEELDISISSIYAALRRLVEVNLLTDCTLAGRLHYYLTARSFRHRIVCMGSGKEYWLADNELERAIAVFCKKHGFEVSDYMLSVQGKNIKQNKVLVRSAS